MGNLVRIDHKYEYNIFNIKIVQLTHTDIVLQWRGITVLALSCHEFWQNYFPLGLTISLRPAYNPLSSTKNSWACCHQTALVLKIKTNYTARNKAILGPNYMYQQNHCLLWFSEPLEQEIFICLIVLRRVTAILQTTFLSVNFTQT